MLQGAVMITTDPHEMNNHYHFTKDEMVIVPVGGAREIANKVVELVNHLSGFYMRTHITISFCMETHKIIWEI